MSLRITRLSRRLAVETDGGVAVVVALSLPVILGFGALALEYGSALVTKSENQRTSDIAAFAAAHAYNRNSSVGATQRQAAARASAESIAKLNGVSSGVSVNFDKIVDEGIIGVIISEDKPIYLSRLLRPDDSVTIKTDSRVALGQPQSKTCILALDPYPDKSEGVRVNGSPAGNYNLKGCDIDSNAEMVVNGSAPMDTNCSATDFNRSNACNKQTQKNTPTEYPYAKFTDWPDLGSHPDEANICDFKEIFPDDLTTEVGKGGNKSLQLNEGTLCVEEYKDGDTISSNPKGSTLIFKEGENLEMKGNPNFSITPPNSGDFAGVAIYAPKSKVILRGTPDFLTDRQCRGLVGGSFEFAGNVSIDLECGSDDPAIDAGGSGPILVR